MRLRLLAVAELEEGGALGTTKNRHKAAIQRALRFPPGTTDTEHNRCTYSVIRLIDFLEASVLNSISLTSEEAVIDFATDRLAEDVRLTQAFGTLAAVAVHGEDIHGGRLDRLADNVRAICFAPIARRGGGCLGHHAVRAANRDLVVVWATVGLAEKSTAWVAGWYGTKCATAATKLGSERITETLLRVVCPESLRSGASYAAVRRRRDIYGEREQSDESVSIAVIRRSFPKLTDEEATDLAAQASRVVKMLGLRQAWHKMPPKRRLSELTDVAVTSACAGIVDEKQVEKALVAQKYKFDVLGPAEPSFTQWCGFSTYNDIVEGLRKQVMLNAEQASAALSDPPDAVLWFWSWFGNPQARSDCQEAASEPSESGSLLDVADALGQSALAVAAREDHTDIVGVLADSSMGTSVNSTDKSGVRVLLHAAKQNNVDCVRVLCANGAARTGELGQNGDGQSALWVAARHNARDCCVLLAEADPEYCCSPNAKDTAEQLHPLDVAIAYGNLHCVDGMVEGMLAASRSDLVSAFAKSRRYTLDTTSSRIDFIAKDLVDADVALVARWLRSHRWLSSSDDGMDASTVELDISQNKFGAVGARFLAEWLREATTAINLLTLSSTGNMRDQKTYTLTAGEEKIDLSQQNLGSADVTLLTVWLQRPEVTAAVTSINCLANKFGDDDLATLLTAIEGTSVRSLCGLTEGQTVADFSRQNLGPIDVKIMAAEYAFQGFIAAVEAVAIGGNPIGSEGGATLLETIKTSKLKTIDIGKPLPLQEPYGSDTLDLSNTKMDPGHVLLLSWWLTTEFSAALNCLTLDMNEIFGKLYWSNVREADVYVDDCDPFLGALKDSKITTLSLQKTGIGPRTLRKLATSLPAALTSINCLANKFGEEDLATLLTAIEGTSVRSLCGLTEGQTTADFSGQNLRPIDCKTLAAEFEFRGFIAAVSSVTLDSTGDTRDHKTYTLTIGEEKIDLSQKNLESADVAFVAAWLQRPEVSAVVEAIAIGANPIGCEGGAILLEAIKTSSLKTIDIGQSLPLQEPYESDTLDLSNMQMDPGHVLLLSWWLGTEFSAALTSISCSGNDAITGKRGRDNDGRAPWIYGEQLEGWTTLCTSLRGSSITSLNFSGCQLGPEALILLADAIKFMAAVARLILDENPLTGGDWRDVDKDITGVSDLFDTLKTSSVTELGLAKCRLGPGSLGKLAEYVRDAEAALNSLTLDSTGDTKDDYGEWKNGGPETYTLTTGDAKIDLSSKNLGHADVALLTAWMQRPEVSAAVTSMNCLKNPIGDDGLATLVAAVEDSSVRSICGLTEGQTTADFSKQNLEPFDCKIIAAEFGFHGFIAAVARLILNENPLTGGGTYDFDTDITGITALCDTLKTSSVTELGLGKCRLGPGSLGKLAEYVRDADAAVEAVAIGGNLIGSAGGATLLETIKTSKLKTIDIGKPLPLQEPYESDTLDLSNTQMDPGHVLLLSWWLTTDAGAAVEAVAIGGNPIGSAGGATLLETIKTSKLKTIDIGKPLPLQEPYESDTLDLSKTGMDPGHVLLLSWWLATDAGAAVEVVVLAQNKLGGRTVDLPSNATVLDAPTVGCIVKTLGDEGYTYFEVTSLEPVRLKDVADGQLLEEIPLEALQSDEISLYAAKDTTIIYPFADFCKSLKTSRVTSLNLSQCELGSDELSELADYIRDATAAVARLILDDNVRTGEIYDADKDISGVTVLFDTLKTSSVTELGLANCRLGPGSLGKLAEYVRDAEAAVARLILDGNPLTGGRYSDDFDKDITGVSALFDTLKTSSVTELCLAKCQLGPGSLGKLTEYIREATAAVNSLTISGNFIFGQKSRDNDGRPPYFHDVDKDQTGWNTLCEHLKVSQVTSFTASDIGMGPVALRTLATSLPAAVNLLTVDSTGDLGYNNGGPRPYTLTGGEDKIELNNMNLGPADITLISTWLAIDAGAAIARLNLSNNPITNYGKDLAGLKALCEALSSLQNPISLDLASCNLKVAEVNEVAKAINAGAALNEVNVAFNKIGSEGGIALRDALKTSNLKFITIGKMYASAGGTIITSSQLTTGVTLSAGGRLGELAKGPDSSVMKLKWADDGSESEWMKLHSLDGEPLKLPLQSPFEGERLDLAHQQLDPGYVLLLSWWLGTEFSAAVARLSLSGNMITGTKCVRRDNYEYDKDLSGLISLCDALLTLKNPIELDLSKCGLSVNGVNPVAKAISAGAAVARLSLSGNMITGTKYVGGGKYEYDKDLSGLISFCDALLTLKNPIELGLSKCGLSVNGVNLVAKAICAGAALNALTLDSNCIFGTLGTWGKPDKFASDCDAFLATLKESNILTLSLQNTGIGPLTLQKLATSLPAALTKIDVRNNILGPDSLKALKVAASQECEILCD